MQHLMLVLVISINGGGLQRIRATTHQYRTRKIGGVHDDSQFDAVRKRGGDSRLVHLDGKFASGHADADAVVIKAGSSRDTGRDTTLLVGLCYF